MLSHDVVLEARDWAFGDNRAAVHYVKTIIDGETEIEVLLDEEDTDFSFLFALQQRQQLEEPVSNKKSSALSARGQRSRS